MRVFRVTVALLDQITVGDLKKPMNLKNKKKASF